MCSKATIGPASGAEGAGNGKMATRTYPTDRSKETALGPAETASMWERCGTCHFYAGSKFGAGYCVKGIPSITKTRTTPACMLWKRTMAEA